MSCLTATTGFRKKRALRDSNGTIPYGEEPFQQKSQGRNMHRAITEEQHSRKVTGLRLSPIGSISILQ